MYDKEKFLINQKNQLARTVFDKMENETYPAIKDWTNETLDQLIYDSEFISINSLNTHLHFIREVHKFVCEEEKVPYNYLKPTKDDLIDYLDFERLRTKTILTPEEFRGLRNELVYVNEDGLEGNFRDVVIYELGFRGLTPKEIGLLENDDEHIERKIVDGKEQIDLHLVTGRTVVINEEQTIYDIKAAQKEQYYYKLRGLRNGDITEDSLEFVYSKYLVRGIANGNTKPDKPIDNVSSVLQRKLKVMDHPFLDLGHFSLSDLRRSFIIQLINAWPDLTATDLALYLGKEYSSDIAWLRIAAKKLKELNNTPGWLEQVKKKRDKAKN